MNVILIKVYLKLLVIIFQCIPTRAFWSRFDPVNPMPASDYRCGINSNRLWWGSAIPNICAEIALIAIPIPYIAKLSLPRAQKMAIGGIFLFGAMYVSSPSGSMINLFAMPFSCFSFVTVAVDQQPPV